MIVALEGVHDASAHGGKAYALARLMKAGLPVPSGFVLDEATPARLATAPALALADGRPLVVRSSAAGEDGRAASFAGQLESILGVDAAGDVEAAVERCRASRRSERVAAYERARGARLAGMGVIVQRQVDARFSGVLFTVRPDVGDGNGMLCEYCEGLGDRLVSGEISPGRVVLPRESGSPNWERELESGARPSAQSLACLAAAGRDAERLFGCPQDIEWAIDADGRLWLLQSRPITAFAPPPRPVLWSNANVNENFPQPISPFLYSIAAAGYTSYFTGLGSAFGISARRLERLEPQLRTIIGVQAGRMYYNLASIHTVLRGMPFGAHLARWFDDFVGAEGPADAGRGAWPALEVLRIAVKTAGQYLLLGRRVQAFEARVDAYAARTAPERLDGKDLLALRDDVRAFLDIRLRNWTDAALADAAAMATYGGLKALLARWMAGENAERLHHGLLRGLDGLASAEPVEALWRLAIMKRRDPAAFEAGLADYLERWGFRFSGELMLTEPSFQERPQELVALLESYATEGLASPAERLEAQKRERLAATRRVLQQAGPLRAALLRPLIAAAQASIGYRERARLKQALLYSRLRRVSLAVGERLVKQNRVEAREDVFFLTAPELDELLSGTAMFPHEVAQLVALRKQAHGKFAGLQPADVLRAREGDYPSWETPRPAASAAELRGSSVCGGKVTGRARVLASVQEARTLQAGDILVTRQTDPGWAPVFVTIGGLVLERGGMLSHGAILAREYGIPTLVGVAEATTRIQDGAAVALDGDNGVVGILR
jgi:phosphohistidine swiveling domain-containing protein